MRRILNAIAACACLPALAAPPAAAPAPQDLAAWLESQGLEAAASKEFQEFQAVVARVKGAKDMAGAQERVVVFAKGKLAWQSNPKDLLEPALKFTLHSLGRDLDGSAQPQLHFSGFSGGAHCCTTHYVMRLKPQVRRQAVYPARNVGGTDFMDLPGRKTPIMISADDSSATVFAPYSNSYFPMVVLEVSPKNVLRDIDFMRDRRELPIDCDAHRHGYYFNRVRSAAPQPRTRVAASKPGKRKLRFCCHRAKAAQNLCDFDGRGTACNRICACQQERAASNSHS